MKEQQAPEILAKQDEQPVAAIQFTPVNTHTTFRAEWGVDGNDIVFHFFLPPELENASSAAVQKYWENDFPHALDAVAREYFKADFPRLKAARVKEYDIDSWWLRANGFADTIDAAGRCRLFFDKLDAALDQARSAVKVSQRPV